MCFPKPYKYEPHFLTRYPGLFTYVCTKASYIIIDNLHPYCYTCFARVRRLYPNHERRNTHLMSDEKLLIVYCCICGFDLVRERIIQNCTICFNNYFLMCRIFKMRGLIVTPHDILKLIFDCVSGKYLRLFFWVPEPIDNEIPQLEEATY